jgi:hypothetical protein
MPSPARVGAQLWLERDTDGDRIRVLVDRAAACGIGVLRIFLVWQWIEPEPDRWVFDMYDAVFDAAADAGIQIKATLCPDSPPWHAGTPGLVQSGHLTLPSTTEQRIRIRRYTHACVSRYAGHPALAQWILWNEPMNLATRPGEENLRRSGELHARWVDLLRKRYSEDLAELNVRWHTGYRSFEEIPFPENIPHPAHRPGLFFSFDPWLAEYELRVESLRDELSWMGTLIREHDETTPTCFNPPDLYRNHAAMGYDLGAQSVAADILGASVHASWHLGFADRTEHLPLVAATIGMLRGAARGRPVELTEVQAGDVYRGSPHARSMPGHELAATYLAALFSGATSVTNWTLNSRQHDFEAGDWALLDFDDEIGERARSLRRVGACLHRLHEAIGDWRPVDPEALVLYSTDAQAMQLAQSWTSTPQPGRGEDEAIQGAGLIAAELLHLGIAGRPVQLPHIAHDDNAAAPLMLASHLVAWSEQQAQLLLDEVAAGRTLVIDGTCGQFDLAAGMRHPWPGHLAEALGVRATRFTTTPDGHPIEIYGIPAGRFPLVRTHFEFSDRSWTSVPGATLPLDADSPILWQRPYRAGRVILSAGPLGPAHVHHPASRALLRFMLDRLVPEAAQRIRPRSSDAITLRVSGGHGTAIAALGPSARDRSGRPLGLILPPGHYRDVWNDSEFESGTDGVELDAPDGIAVIVNSVR